MGTALPASGFDLNIYLWGSFSSAVAQLTKGAEEKGGEGFLIGAESDRMR